MRNLLLVSQDGKLNIFPELISTGRRQPMPIIGDKLKEVLEAKKMSSEELIKTVGNSYRASLTRVLENQEIPKKQLVEKICKVLEIEETALYDTELENVICVQNGIVVAKYDTNARTEEVRKEVAELLQQSHLDNKKVVYQMPEK